MKNPLINEEKDVKNIFNMFLKKDFKGNAGQVVKNSAYQLSTTLISKIGSLLLTIILARLLLPELFGLYSLALSTILIFTTLSDIGLGPSIITFISKNLIKNDQIKAKSYFKELLKYKIIFTLISSIIMLSLAYFISNNYYNKPIFLALLAGGIYLPIVSFLAFIEDSFKAINNFKPIFFKEIFFQIIKFILIPLSVFLVLKYTSSKEFIIMIIIIIFSICYFLSLLFLLSGYRKKISFLNSKNKLLNSKEKKNLRNFIWPISATVFSGIFLGYVDTVMLGHFVSEEFIGYYSPVINLIGSAATIIGFGAAAIFPMFARLQGKSLDKAFKKARNLTLILSILGAVISLFFAPIIIKLIYGQNYLNSIPLLRYFSFLLIILPIISIYEGYITSQEKTKAIAYLLVFTTFLNIILNYFFIIFGLRYGMLQATFGACAAVLISRYVYFIGLMVYKRRLNRQILK